MRLIKSVCTNLFFPQSRKDITAFVDMASFLNDMGVESIEFYHDGVRRDRIGDVLASTGIKGVYIAVIPHKEQMQHLCNEDPANRAEAVKLAKFCIDEAQDNGISEIMFNSGRIGINVELGLDALFISFEELYEYIAKKRYTIQILMEPCDSHMDAFQLIGPNKRTLEFVERMHTAGLPLKLTMDTAHTVEEGEDFLQALMAVKPYCNHIHFANCNISDKDSPFYGDKHVGYEYPSTEWPPEELAELFGELKKLYPGDEPLRIGLEVLCREEDPYSYFEKVCRKLDFLHISKGDAL